MVCLEIDGTNLVYLDTVFRRYGVVMNFRVGRLLYTLTGPLVKNIQEKGLTEKKRSNIIILEYCFIGRREYDTNDTD